MSEIGFHERLKDYPRTVPGKDVRITMTARFQDVVEDNLIRVEYRRRVRCQACVN